MRTLGRHALILLLAGASLPPTAIAAPSATDTVVAEVAGNPTIAARDGILAWSARDGAKKRFRLMIQGRDGVVAPANVAPDKGFFDVSLGATKRGRIVALYTRCARSCDVYRYDLAAKTERRIATVSSPRFDEAWPAQDGDRIAFVRRARTRVSYMTGLPLPAGSPKDSGEMGDCDVPYVRDLSSGRPSRRLDRGTCTSVTGLTIRGATIAYTGTEMMSSTVRLLSAQGGRQRLLASQGFGEGGDSVYTQPSLSGTHLYTLRDGMRGDAPPAFIRIALRGRTALARDPQVNLAGGFARDEHGTIWYGQAPPADIEEDTTGGPPCDDPSNPCRIVRAGADPFSSVPRLLLPEISVDGLKYDTLEALGPDAVINGRVARSVVRRGRVTGTEPAAGVTVRIAGAPLTVVGEPKNATKCERATVERTTDADGRWSLALTGLDPKILYCRYSITAPALRIGFPVVTVYGVR